MSEEVDDEKEGFEEADGAGSQGEGAGEGEGGAEPEVQADRDTGGEGSAGGDVGGIKRKRGRPKGSKTRPAVVRDPADPRRDAILSLFYTGVEVPDICVKFNISPKEAWGIIRESPIGNHRRAIKASARAVQEITKGRLSAATPLASDAVLHVLSNPKSRDSMKLRAAAMIFGAGGIPVTAPPPPPPPPLVKIDQSTQQTNVIAISKEEIMQMLRGAVQCGVSEKELTEAIEAAQGESRGPGPAVGS